MIFSLDFIILLLQALQCKGFSVQQEHLIQTAFANEQVNTTCKATFPYKQEYLQFKIFYYREDSKGNVTVNIHSVSEIIPPGQENTTARKIYDLCIKPTAHASVTGTYYCKVQWSKERRVGPGTFIFFRDKGYIEPFFTTWVSLLVVTTILAVLSILGTALLFWKRQVVCPEKCGQVKKCPSQGLESKHTLGSSESPGSIYTDLEPRHSGVYFVIKKNEGKSSLRKMPASEVSQQEMQREISDLVYENL